VATEAARLKGKTSYREEKEKPTEKEKTDLTLTGLLMEGLEPLMPLRLLVAYLRLSNQGRRHAAWSHAKIQYLCLQSGTPQTHTTGSGHGSSRLAYLTLYFHDISAS
jgi:hypothetical protein